MKTLMRGILAAIGLVLATSTVSTAAEARDHHRYEHRADRHWGYDRDHRWHRDYRDHRDYRSQGYYRHDRDYRARGRYYAGRDNHCRVVWNGNHRVRRCY